MLFTIPKLGPDEHHLLARIDEQRRALQYAVMQRRRWIGLLRRNTIAHAVQGSISIEGYHATIEDVIAVAEGAETLDASAETRSAVAGYQSAMTYAREPSGDPHFSYSGDLIRSLHFMMLQHDLTKHPGRWRPGPIFVRDDVRGATVYQGPDAERIPALMDELVAWLREGDLGVPAMVRAAMGQSIS